MNLNFLPSSATNDQGSKITTKTLEKIFQKDRKMLKLPPISTTKSNPGLIFSFELLISSSERKKDDNFFRKRSKVSGQIDVFVHIPAEIKYKAAMGGLNLLLKPLSYKTVSETYCISNNDKNMIPSSVALFVKYRIKLF